MAVVEAMQAGEESGRRRLRLATPVTLEPVGEIEVGRGDDVGAAVERARKAQADWGALPVRERGRLLERAARVLLERQDEIVGVLAEETGRPPTEALARELAPACDTIQYHARRAHRVLADRRVPLHLLRTKQLRLVHRPLGVVAVVTPRSLPFLLSCIPAVQALMAGNAVVHKPSEFAPFSGRLVAELLEAAGLPDGVFQCLLGDGETGAALVEADVDGVCFVGRAATGQRVAEACARRLVPCTLALGAKDPMIVCRDADLERAAAAAVYGAFAGAGQLCTSTARVYVEDAVAEAFVRRVVDRTAALRQGPAGESDVGPLIDAAALETVERQVDEATAAGARVLSGGRRNPEWEGLYWEPTVLVDVDHGMAVMREETFGPVLPVMRVGDPDEAVRLANDSPFGLGASVWTRDRRRGHALAARLEAGTVAVNDAVLVHGIAEAPFGGRKQSGVGRLHGEMGLRGFCHVQSVVTDRLGSKSGWVWYPYTSRKARTLRRLMRLLWATPLGRWLS